MAKMTRWQQQQAAARRQDLIGCVVLSTISAALLATPFVLCWLYPAQMTRFIWGI